MKKYLMTVMAAVALGGLFVGCSNDVDLNGGNTVEFNIVQNYENAFITRFGQPHENQTWGFGESVAGTRANNPGEDVPYTSDAINANANEWADPTPGKTYGGWVVPDPLTPDQKELVMKYFQAVPNRTYDDPHYRHFFIQQVYKGHDNPPTTGNYELNTAAGGSTYTSDNMNYLTVGHNEAHINDFNTGSCSTKSVGDNDYTVNDNKRHPDEISLMVNIDDTECFGYHNSGCSIQRNDKAGLVHWTTIRTWAIEQGIYDESKDILNDKWDRSFMGFDFELLSKEDSYLKDNSGNVVYAQFSNGQLNGLQYVYYGENNIMKRGSRPASTRRAATRATRAGETSVNIFYGDDQIKNSTPKYFSLSDEAKELLAAGNYLGVDLSVVPGFYFNENWNGTYTNWGIKLIGHWGEGSGGRLDNGSFTLSANSTNVEMQLSESDVAILKQQTLTILPTADPVNISRIYISNYSQANGGGSSSETEIGESQGGESQGGESQGGESQGGESQSGESQSGESQSGESQNDDNYEIYDSEYLIVDGERIPFLIENKNMYGGEKYLNGDEMLKDADMTIEADGKQCFNMAKIKKLVDDGYLPVWNSNLRTWVKWGGGDGYYSDWIVTLTEAKRINDNKEEKEEEEEEEEEEETDDPSIVCRIIVEDLTVGENSDFDFNDVVFDVCHNGTLIIRAIGGELPIYIGAENTNEVHAACSIPLSNNTNQGKNSHLFMMNTGWKSTGSSKEYEGIDYDADLGHIVLNRTFNTPADALEIGIWVHKNGENIKLKAPRGKVASMVCVGTDYKWCAERQDIDAKYHKDGVKLFHQYVIGDPEYQGKWQTKNAWYHKMNQ